MQDLSLDDFQEFRNSIANVLEQECSNQLLHRHINSELDLDARIWGLASELGWLGVGLSENVGGLGLGTKGLSVLHRELGRKLAPGSLIAALSFAQWVERFGNDTQREAFLPPMISGHLRAAVPAMPMDESSGELRLRDGCLQGRVHSMLGSEHSEVALVCAVDDAGGRQWGIVNIDPATVKLIRLASWDMTRTLCAMECDGAALDIVLMGDHRQGTHGLTQLLSLAVSCDSLGGMEAVFEATVDYLKERVQFDRVLASFQALKHRVANISARIEVMRELTLHAIEAGDARLAGSMRETMLSKAAVTDAHAWVAQDCLQLFGGVGFTWEYDCHLYLKRARLNQSLVASNGACVDAAFREMAASARNNASIAEMSV